MLPRARPLDTNWVEHEGQTVLLLRDRLGLAQDAVVVPAAVGLLLSLCDGTRDHQAIKTAFELNTGLDIDVGLIGQIITQLEEALILEGPRIEARKDQALREYRNAPFRAPSLAGIGYPAQPEELDAQLTRFIRESGTQGPATSPKIRGMISPHIDYQRGWPIYSKVWQRAANAAREAEVVVIFGTDHLSGMPITVTRQHYATPFGALPTAHWAVDALVDTLGADSLLTTELHHRSEHSIEEAIVWLHYVRGRAPVEVVPILCGSFHEFTDGEADPGRDPLFDLAIRTLREAIGQRRLLVVAAADLAHVGPAFGDAIGLSPAEKNKLRDDDASLLAAACTGEAEAFFAPLREERDQRRICGLPPIYLALRLLGGSCGELVAYDQCPADENGGSVVSIAGVVYS